MSDVSPPSGSITRVSSAVTRTTGVDVRLNANDGESGVAERKVGESLASAAWAPFIADEYVRLTLTSGDGMKSVSALFKDNVGNVAAMSADTWFILDTRGPNITPVSPRPGSTGNPYIGLEVKANWEDNMSVTRDVAGVDAGRASIMWYDGGLDTWRDVTDQTPLMVKTTTGFTYTPAGIVPGKFYKISVYKADLAGNSNLVDWGFWT